MFRLFKDKNGLTSLDYRIYDFLKDNSKAGNWIGMQELADMFEITPRQLRYSITRIRKCPMIQKVLVSDYQKGYKFLTTDDENTEYIKKRKIKALKELKQVYLDIERLNLNGQLKLVFDTQERNFIESLVK